MQVTLNSSHIPIIEKAIPKLEKDLKEPQELYQKLKDKFDNRGFWGNVFAGNTDFENITLTYLLTIKNIYNTRLLKAQSLIGLLKHNEVHIEISELNELGIKTSELYSKEYNESDRIALKRIESSIRKARSRD
jgi:hypothetical protein